MSLTQKLPLVAELKDVAIGDFVSIKANDPGNVSNPILEGYVVSLETDKAPNEQALYKCVSRAQTPFWIYSFDECAFHEKGRRANTQSFTEGEIVTVVDDRGCIKSGELHIINENSSCIGKLKTKEGISEVTRHLMGSDWVISKAAPVKKIRVYLVGNSVQYADFIPNRILVTSMNDADVVLFTGGADINPALYGDNVHHTTHFDEARDTKEVIAFDEAEFLGKPIIGICRGAQLLCVMAGGKLCQDISHQNNTHPVLTYDGELLSVNSLHHQLQFPYNLPTTKYEVLAYSENLSSHHVDGDGVEMITGDMKEAEAVYYPEIKALGIQWHPEMLVKTYPKQQQWILKQLKNKLNLDIHD